MNRNHGDDHPHQALYNSRQWRKRRAECLRQDPVCKICHRKPSTHADHLEPHRGDLDKFWTGRLQGTCASCHSSTKQRLEKSGRVIGCDVEGMPLDGRWKA